MVLATQTLSFFGSQHHLINFACQFFDQTKMKIYRDINNLPKFNRAVITVGSFDGIHRGHQRLLSKIHQLAQNNQGESVVITFHPHPRRILDGRESVTPILTTLDEKIQLFEQYGVANLVIVPFSIEFSQMQPLEYIQNFLVAKFNPSIIVIGYDHRFGLNRGGDIYLLREYAAEFHYEIVEIDKLTVDAMVISSTHIRRAILDGNLVLANKLLNHRYVLNGKVIHGEKIGSSLGYPTANIKIEDKDKLIPKTGIYTAWIRVEGQLMHGMVYIGHRPVLKNRPELTIEVHIFDFQSIIYHKTLTVELIEFLREERNFDALDDLKEQLIKDELEARMSLDRYQENFAPLGKDELVVAILNFNGEKLLPKFLPSVIEHTPKIYPIYVIDNGSSDRSIELIQTKYPEVKLIRLDTNLGFVGGYNQALKIIDADLVMLLNSDVEVTHEWLNPLKNILDKNKLVGAVQPKILSFKHKHQFEYAGAAGGWIDSLGYPFCKGRVLHMVEDDHGQYDRDEEIFWASGAAMLIRKDLFDRLGGFDPSYFAHQEEIDLCWRMKRAGFSIYSCGTSQVYHLGGATLDYQQPRKLFLNFHNNLRTITKNNSIGTLIWLLPFRVFLDLIAAVKLLYNKRPVGASAILKAQGQFIVSLPGIWRRRAVELKAIRLFNPVTKNTLSCVYKGSLLWSHYVSGKEKFGEMVKEKVQP